MRWAFWFTVLFAAASSGAEPASSARLESEAGAAGRARAASQSTTQRAQAAAGAEANAAGGSLVAGSVDRRSLSTAGHEAGAGAAPGDAAVVAPPASIAPEAPPPILLPSAAQPELVAPLASELPQSSPAPSESALAPRPGASVRIGDSSVFMLRTSRGTRSAEERARTISQALSAVVEDPRASEVKVVRQADTAVVYVGATPLVELTEEDARLAGDGSLDLHAGAVAGAVRSALTSERQRSQVAKNVFSVSLVVFFALIAFYVLRKIGAVVERLRTWLEENGDRLLTVRVQRIELVRPAMLKSTALVALGLAKWIAQFGVLYAWLVIVLSLFDATRGYTERLTGLVVTPLSQLMTRIAIALPLLVVASIAALAVLLLVRFVGLFFASVARRESTLAWLPADLAAPTSVLLRIGIVIAALVFAAPVVTGDPNGALGRAGAIALIAIGLSGTPLLASGLVGAIVLFGRRLRVGDHAEVGGALGRISAIDLLELRLETADRSELRIPHLLLLTRPVRSLGLRPRLALEVLISAEAAPRVVQEVLDEAAGRVGRDVRVEVLCGDADGISYRVSATCDALEQRSRLTLTLLEALSAAGIALGRAGGLGRR